MNRKKQLTDFFEGNLSDEAAREVLEWLQSEEGREELAANIDEQWHHHGEDEAFSEWDMEHLLRTTRRAKLGKDVVKRLESKRFIPATPAAPKRRLIRAPLFRVAAVLTALVGLAYLLLEMREASNPPASAALNELVTRSNAAGVKTKLRLPDGSLVYLNSASTISYRKDFATDRQIELAGEAYFEVKHDPLHPFSVKSKGLTTVALGTSFNVKAFDEEKQVEVTLVEGKVRVSDSASQQAIVLAPGEAAGVSEGQAQFTKYKSDVTYVTQWMHGVLEFRDSSFAEIFHCLERWYGVEITVVGPMTKAKGSGKFRDGESLENVLEVLGYSAEFDYIIQKDKIKITFK